MPGVLAVGRVLATLQGVAGTALFVLSVRVHASASERRELAQALLAWLVAVRRSAGLAEAHVGEDLQAAATYVLSSAWHRREDFENHVAGPDFGILLGAFDVLGHDTQVVVTAAADGDEDGWSQVRRLRGRGGPEHRGPEGPDVAWTASDAGPD